MLLLLNNTNTVPYDGVRSCYVFTLHSCLAAFLLKVKSLWSFSKPTYSTHERNTFMQWLCACFLPSGCLLASKCEQLLKLQHKSCWVFVDALTAEIAASATEHQPLQKWPHWFMFPWPSVCLRKVYLNVSLSLLNARVSGLLQNRNVTLIYNSSSKLLCTVMS